MSALGPRYASTAFGARNEILKAKRVKYTNDDFGDAVEDVEDALDALKAAITAVEEGGVTGLTAADISYTNAGLTGPPVNVEEALDVIVDDLGLLQTAIDATDLAVDGLNAEVAALDGRLDTAETTLTSLDGRLDTAESTLTSLDGRVDTTETDITALDGRIDTLEGASGAPPIVGSKIKLLQIDTTCTSSGTTNLLTFTKVASTVYSCQYNIMVTFSRAAVGTNQFWQHYHGCTTRAVASDGSSLGTEFADSSSGNAIPTGSTVSFSLTDAISWGLRFSNATARDCHIVGTVITSQDTFA